jgi:hypothetical protein
MGLWKLLTKPLSLSSAKLSWNEPMFFRPRLRGDLWLRLLVVLGAWLAASGALLIIFSSNANPPARPVAFGLGLLGAGVAYLCVLARRNQSSGTCRLYANKLVWDSVTGGGFSGHMSVSITWEYGVIETCRIVSADELGKPFSVLILEANADDVMVIGIPGSVELRDVARVLKAGGVAVSSARSVSSRLVRPLPFAVGIVSAVAGLSLLLTGFLLNGDDPGNVERHPIARPDIEPFNQGSGLPQMDNGLPENTTDTNEAKPGRPPALPGFAGATELIDGLPPGLPRLQSGRPFNPPDLAGNGPNVLPSAGGGGTAGVTDAASDARKGNDSELLGGSGGVPFRTTNPDGRPIVAVEYSLGNWAGRERVGQLIPRFDRATVAAQAKAVIAPDGYAIGAAEVHADDLVNAIRFVFMRQKPDGTLTSEDSVHSDWIGQPTADTDSRVISGRGQPVIGLVGRGAAVLDAVGLIFATAVNE